jgi:uncharacterized membrane protein
MKFEVKKLAAAAAVGALYAALTLGLAPISYGAVQFRIAEALCILPFFFPASAIGLTAGCVIANFLGPGAGVLDVVFGSLATLLAGLCTAMVGERARRRESMGWGVCAAACLMPVLFNAPVIGMVIAYASLSEPGAMDFWRGALVFGAQVGLGEAAVLFALGLPALRYILKNPTLMGLLQRID